jgi:hypothetical protein
LFARTAARFPKLRLVLSKTPGQGEMSVNQWRALDCAWIHPLRPSFDRGAHLSVASG